MAEPEFESEEDEERERARRLEEWREEKLREAAECFRRAEEAARAQGKTLVQVWNEFWERVRADEAERVRRRKQAEEN
jgi:hypothetical protein